MTDWPGAMDGEIGPITAPEASAVPDVLDALVGLWRARLLLVATAVLGGILALVYVASSPVLYTAQLTLSPSEASPSESAGRLGSLASLAGIATGSHASSPFDLFLLALQSRQVATVIARDDTMLRNLFPQRWDASGRRWRTMPEASVGNSLRHLLGLPGASAGRPSAGEVNDVLAERVEIGQNAERGTATILFMDADPAFAVTLIARITKAADDVVKARSLARSTEYITYIEDKLRAVTLAEDRAVLAAELGARERSAMLASSGLPFAGDPIGTPTASTRPTSPRVFLTLAIGVGSGIAAGLLLILVLHARRRLQQSRE